MRTGKTAAVYAFSGRGRALAGDVEEFLRQTGYDVRKRELDETWFREASALIFIGACGIAVRKIAPFLRDKRTDPAVVVVDEQAKYCISLLSGHVGGANELCAALAQKLQAEAVITTATDLAGKFAVDVFAAKNSLIVSDWQLAKQVSAALLREETVGLGSELPLDGFAADHDYAGLCLQEKGKETGSIPALGIWIGNRKESPFSQTLFLRPKNLVLGIGCRLGKTADEIRAFVEKALCREGLFLEQVVRVCSIDVKKEEAGLQELCTELGVPFQVFSAEELSRAEGDFHESEFVKSRVGIGNVCERSAVLGSGSGRLLLGKQAEGGITLAVAERERTK